MTKTKINNDLRVQAMRAACMVVRRHAKSIAAETATELEKILQLPHNAGVDVKELAKVAFEPDWCAGDEIMGDHPHDVVAQEILAVYGLSWWDE